MTENIEDGIVLYNELYNIHSKLCDMRTKFYKKLIMDNNCDKNIIYFCIKLLFKKINNTKIKMNKMSVNDTPDA